MNRLTISRIAFVATRVIALYLGARTLITGASQLIFSLDIPARIAWRFWAQLTAGVVVAVVVWAVAGAVADKIGRDAEGSLIGRDEAVEGTDAPPPAARSTEELLRLAFIIIGVLFVAWGIEGLGRTAVASIESDFSSQLAERSRSWLEVYRDDLVAHALQLALGLFFVFRGRATARALALREARATSRAAEGEAQIGDDERDERVTFKFD